MPTSSSRTIISPRTRRTPSPHSPRRRVHPGRFPFPELYGRLQVVAVNAGRLPSGRCAEADGEARRGGPPGDGGGADEGGRCPRVARSLVRFPASHVTKGVRYRVGSTRGHLVTVGTQLQIADTGFLSVTNQRIAYLGSSKTLDMPYTKVMGMTLYCGRSGLLALEPAERAPLIKVTIDLPTLSPHSSMRRCRKQRPNRI